MVLHTVAVSSSPTSTLWLVASVVISVFFCYPSAASGSSASAISAPSAPLLCLRSGEKIIRARSGDRAVDVSRFGCYSADQARTSFAAYYQQPQTWSAFNLLPLNTTLPWLQPSFYPDFSRVNSHYDDAATASNMEYSTLRDNCATICHLRQGKPKVQFALAYGRCVCIDTGDRIAPDHVLPMADGCCHPAPHPPQSLLPVPNNDTTASPAPSGDAGKNSTGGGGGGGGGGVFVSPAEQDAALRQLLSMSPRPATCSRSTGGSGSGELLLFGIVYEVAVSCPLNSTMCHGALGCVLSATTGCCIPTDSSNGGGGDGDDESKGPVFGYTIWIISFIMVGAVIQTVWFATKYNMRAREQRRQAQRERDRERRDLARALLMSSTHDRDENLLAEGHDEYSGGVEGARRSSSGSPTTGSRRGEVADDGSRVIRITPQQQRALMRVLGQQRQAAAAAGHVSARTKVEAETAAADAIATLSGQGYLVGSEDVDQEESCPMCLELLSVAPSCLELVCTHMMHVECLQEFLAHRLRNSQASISCPICRQTVLLQRSVVTVTPPRNLLPTTNSSPTSTTPTGRQRRSSAPPSSQSSSPQRVDRRSTAAADDVGFPLSQEQPQDDQEEGTNITHLPTTDGDTNGDDVVAVVSRGGVRVAASSSPGRPQQQQHVEDDVDRLLFSSDTAGNVGGGRSRMNDDGAALEEAEEEGEEMAMIAPPPPPPPRAAIRLATRLDGSSHSNYRHRPSPAPPPRRGGASGSTVDPDDDLL